MSDGKIVNDWIDADKLKKIAEDLMQPVDSGSVDQQDAATFGQDFVGFAEPEQSSGTAGQARSLEKARETLSRAQGTAVSAGISASGTPAPIAAPVTPPVAQAVKPTVANVTLPVKAAESVKPPLPVVKPAIQESKRPAIQSPFKIVTEKISPAELARLPRSV